MTTIDEFEHFLHSRRAKTIVYHTGLLMFDRLKIPGMDDYNKRAEEIDDLADAVWAAYREGKIHLTQRHIDTSYDYIATKALEKDFLKRQ
jgi:hypothetical protein